MTRTSWMDHIWSFTSILEDLIPRHHTPSMCPLRGYKIEQVQIQSARQKGGLRHITFSLVADILCE